VNPQTGESHWVFESADPETRSINATDRRFFWLALYAQPALWIVLGVVAIIKIVSFIAITPLWITLVSKCPLSVRGFCSLLIFKVIALVLTITNTLAFSRCDRFSQATGFASSALHSGGFASNLASGMIGRSFTL